MLGHDSDDRAESEVIFQAEMVKLAETVYNLEDYAMILP
ncbi:hypothetical protein Lpp17_2271 [Lacticaseibacillus paracasei subsp. paracasei Lpp17]|jgi:hypothetical protein|nr:hypothetical protein Lpp17_2271 [Lacticaseibacillus paracasei subsp. paracasei Lpp17]